MGSFLLLIPGIFELLEKVIGPLITTNSVPILTSITSHLGSGKVKDMATGIIGDLEGVVGQITDEKKLELKTQLDSILGQVDIDKLEAVSESRFDSGWRPFIGWVCGLALAMSILVEPTVNYLAGWFNTIAPPIFELSPIVMSLICGLCGIYMIGRTAEKKAGVN